MSILKPFFLALAFTVFSSSQAALIHRSPRAHLSSARAHIHPAHKHSAHKHSNHIHSRALPGTWTSQGCYIDPLGPRALNAAGFASGTTMTGEACVNFCNDRGFVYAGTEYSAECYCDNVLHGGGPAPAGDCNMPCSGNPAETCGAGGRLNLYGNGQTPPPGPTTAPTIGNWASSGCYSDNVNGGRTLTVGMAVSGGLTMAKCTTACFNAGYPLAGGEYAGECFCGSSFQHGGAPAPAAECNMVCNGNSQEYCGGPNRLNVYHYTGTDLPGGGGGGPPPVGDPPPAGGPAPVTSGLPAGWTYDACWVDNAHGRIMQGDNFGGATNTVESCIAGCISRGFTLAGMEYSTECYCGNTLVNGAVRGLASECNMGCGGSASEACGGPNRVSVYTGTGGVTALPVPTTQTTNLPGSWQYQGCLREPGGPRVLPNQIIWPTNNSAVACMNQCAAFGFPASGTEYGQECYCGDITDVAARGAVFGDASECNMPCPGDPTHICGQGDRVTLYYWTGTPMNNWHTPSNTGRYEFFVPGVVVPLIATLGINNKVTFLEKSGTGFPNSTGAYELDLTLTQQFSKTWREMHLKSDVFCAGSVILPDKAGRQINIGGWSLESTFGVRLYTPDGTDGVNGTNDWEENYATLKLQRGRWYPTAVMMSNGSILVVGGETGSNAAPQPNLEILPKPPGGDTVLELDWLRRTDPNNLYPFVFILPSTRIFVGYWNEARILDPVTFNTFKVLPNIPGSVTNFLAGRTYPLEGAAMLLPQHAPYTDPLEVLICGGSTIGAGEALDNCVTIAPEAATPQWTMERMPSRRVLSCMVGLPDGTYMILNGAHQGVAGFGLANNPNLNALLYDPTQPIGSRISILNNTIVARMYHSEATLLPDGRVLVSGSDPQTNNDDGTVKYPEEFRIEVYIPPYLNQGITPPTFTIPNTDWAYGGQYTITVQGSTADLRITLLGASSSTHGNSMGGRTIFPAFTCAGSTCTITAPPNSGVSPPGWHQLFVIRGPTPSHSKWVRIGGDPAQLGNWPALPGFTPPGM